MAVTGFSPSGEAKFRAILARYPVKRAAILPVLWLAQEEFGYLSHEVLTFVAERLELSPAFVASVASFYSMLYKRPMGKYHIQVCRNLSCSLLGAEAILACLKERLGIDVGETTPDGKFSLSEVECLASCGTAPMMQINDRYWENLTPARTLEIIDRLAEE